MKRFITAAATVLAAMFLLFVAANCGDEFWMGTAADGVSAPDASAPQVEVAQVDPCAGVNCDDKNACTDDTCDPKIGCAHANNKAACDDSDPCTTGDWCSAGACQQGTPVNCDDGNLCTTDKCTVVGGKAGCVSTPNTAACDDGDICTKGDKCKDGACAGGYQANCDDGNPCTVDSCDPATGCKHTADNAVCDDANACTDDACDLVKGCVFKPNTKPCDDGNVCTAGDKCKDGACVGGASLLCDDANACTDDACDLVKGCLFKPNTKPCDDGNVCTSGDKCKDGACAGLAVSQIFCDDGNPCTVDSCDPVSGCTHKPAVASPPFVCDDGNPCTVDDKCFGGKCAAGPQMDCDDANPCTDDACKGGVCVHMPNAAQCDDDDANTTGDKCSSGGSCKGTQKQSGGCKTAADCAAFDDGNACNGVAICKSGLCGLTEPVVCAPSSACTVSSCDPATGACKEGQAQNAKPCDDGNACTSGDACQNGACKGELVNCDDANPCTDDSCNGGVCKHTPNAAQCDDGNACTSADKCTNGACASGANTCECQSNADCAALEDGNACNGTLVCNAAKKCVVDPKTVVSCSATQDTACAANTCDPSTGKCAFMPANASKACNDNNACTSGDICSGGKCMGDAVNCDDANLCTDDACDPAKGCAHANNAAPCDDGNALTTGDACKYGKCVGVLAQVDCAKDTDCDDSLFCNGTEKCVLGLCKPGTKPNCDDGIACTTDACVEAVDLSGNHCQYAQVDSLCPSGQFCHKSLYGLGLQGCVQCEKSSDCDDKNPCTDDLCNAKSGLCEHKAITSSDWGWPSCSDGSACTKGDACKDGKCVGEVVNCDDGNPCTNDSCDPAKGCAHANNTAACDDGNACTSGDKCSDGGCKGAQVNADDGNACTYDYCDKQYGVVHYAKNCDDGNACTTDVCDAAKGCVYIPNTAPCSDGSACTTGDACSGGSCGSGATLKCDDADACTLDACDPKVGCTHSKIAGCPAPAPQPSLWAVSISVELPAGVTTAEAHIFYADTVAPATKAAEKMGPAPFSVSLGQVEACTWGVEIAARVPSGTWPWYGCDAGAPSLSTLIVKVNGVVKTGTLTKHPWACGGAGEGNLAFTPAQLGCP